MSKVVTILLTTGALAVGFGAGYIVADKRAKKKLDVDLDILNQQVRYEVELFKQQWLDSQGSDTPLVDNATKYFSSPKEAVEVLVPKEFVEEMTEAALYSTETTEYFESDDDSIIRKNLFEEPQPSDEEVLGEQKGEDDIPEVEPIRVITEPEYEEPEPQEESEEDYSDGDSEGDSEEVEGFAMPPRDLEHPYVITYEQFMDDTFHKDNKVSLVYFVDGDTLMEDGSEQIIDDSNSIVGDSNLQQFGLGSHDRNAVYVRNELLETDFEIVRDKRSFLEVVHGVRPIKSGPRRMRDDDE